MKVIVIAAGVALPWNDRLEQLPEAMPLYLRLDPGYSNVLQAHYRVIYRCPRRGLGYTYGYERGAAPRGDIYGYSYGERYGMRGRHEGSRAFTEGREEGRYGARNRGYGGRSEGLATGRSSAQGRAGAQGGSAGMMNRNQGGSPMESRRRRRADLRMRCVSRRDESSVPRRRDVKRSVRLPHQSRGGLPERARALGRRQHFVRGARFRAPPARL